MSRVDDFSFQLGFVKDAARRLLWQQDRDPVSPSRGCFHCAYWRDKTSDHADARFQEAGAALGLLAHPELHDASLPPRAELLAAFLEGARFLARVQHADGSFDEWWKGERGFAATEFPVVAYALALWLLGEEVPAPAREEILAVLRRGADWLIERDDLVKTNHQAAACAALALVHALTGEERYAAGARAKRDFVLRAQNEEGWFNEVAGMDLGYCGVLLDYMALADLALPDPRTAPALGRLAAFLHRFVTPALTIPAEAGICLNPYLTRLGAVLLARSSPHMADLVRRFEAGAAGFEGVAPYLADDLRLCRWAYLPAATALLRARLSREGVRAAAAVPAPEPAAAFFPKAGVYARIEEGLWLCFAPAGAGFVEARFGGMVLRDRGWRLRRPGRPDLFTGGYDAGRPAREVPGGLAAEVAFAPAVFFYPPYLARVILRLGCVLPGGSYWLRRGIDLYRQWKGTALNQSAAPVAAGGSGLTLTRTVRVAGGAFEIEDEIASSGEEPDWDALEALVEGNAVLEETRARAPGRLKVSRRTRIPASAGLRK